MPSDQRDAEAAVCYPCSHFEAGGIYDAEDVLARKILRYPISGEVVRSESMALIGQAGGRGRGFARFAVHVEKGRSIVRLSVTGA